MTQTSPALPRFTSRKAYYAWAEQQPVRGWERHGNQVVAIAPGRALHDQIRSSVRRALEAALRAAGVPCRVSGDGTRVGIDEDTDYEPDVVVARDGPGAFAPIIIVEVSSPAISRRDLNIRIADYFLLPSVRHCLIVTGDERQVIHHRLGRWGELVTSTSQDGSIRLDPPGLLLAVADIYPDDLP